MAVLIRGPDQRRRLPSGLFSGARRSHASWVCVGGPIAPGRTPCFMGEWRGRAGTSPPVALVAVMPVTCGRTFHTCVRASDESLVIVLNQPCVYQAPKALVSAPVGPVREILGGDCVAPAGVRMPVGVWLSLYTSLWVVLIPFSVCPLLLACHFDLLSLWREFSGLRMGEASVPYCPCQGDRECEV